MDLALASGRLDVEKLADDLLEGDFVEWSRYASQKGLPWARLEFLLAQIAMFVDHGLCGGTRSLREYMMIDKAQQAEEIDGMEDLFAGSGGGGIVIKGNVAQWQTR